MESYKVKVLFVSIQLINVLVLLVTSMTDQINSVSMIQPNVSKQMDILVMVSLQVFKPNVLLTLTFVKIILSAMD